MKTVLDDILDYLYWHPEIVVAIVIPSVFIFVIYLANLILYLEFKQKVEILRSNYFHVRVTESEDVVGKVADANMQIVSMKYWNSIPVLELLFPDGWDDIKLIEIKHGTNN